MKIRPLIAILAAGLLAGCASTGAGTVSYQTYLRQLDQAHAQLLRECEAISDPEKRSRCIAKENAHYLNWRQAKLAEWKMKIDMMAAMQRSTPPAQPTPYWTPQPLPDPFPPGSSEVNPIHVRIDPGLPNPIQPRR